MSDLIPLVITVVVALVVALTHVSFHRQDGRATLRPVLRSDAEPAPSERERR